MAGRMNEKWSEAKRVSGDCAVHGFYCQNEIRHHPRAGKICSVAWFASPRCECGSGLPINEKSKICRNCEIGLKEEFEPVIEDYVYRSSVLGQAVEPSRGKDDLNDGTEKQFRRRLSEAAKERGVEMLSFRDTNIWFNSKILAGKMKDERGKK